MDSFFKFFKPNNVVDKPKSFDLISQVLDNIKSFAGNATNNLIGTLGNSVSVKLHGQSDAVNVPNQINRNIFTLGGGVYFGPGSKFGVFGEQSLLESYYGEASEITKNFRGLQTNKAHHKLRELSKEFRGKVGNRLLFTKHGAAFSAAYFASNTSDISDVNIKMGNASIPVSEAIAELKNKYLKISSPLAVNPFKYRQNLEEAQAYHQELATRIGKLGYNVLGTKAELFREGGIVSKLKLSELGWGINFEEAAKGLHKRQNIAFFSKRIAEKNKFVTPVIGGSMMGEEILAVNQMADEFGLNTLGRFPDKKLPRIGVRTALAIAQIDNNGSLSRLRDFGDSGAFGSGRVFNLLQDPALQGSKLATFDIALGSGGIDDANLHPALKAAIQGRSTTHVKSRNAFMFDKAVKINAQDFAGINANNRVILGLNALPEGHTDADLMRSAVFAGNDSVMVRGFRVLNNRIRILTNNPDIRYNSDNITSPVMIGDKAMQLESNVGHLGWDIGGRRANILARAEDVGLTIKDGKFVVKDRFLSQQYLPSIIAASAERGQLKQFAGRLGLNYNAGIDGLIEEFVSENSHLNPSEMAAKIHQMSDSELSQIGLNRSDLGALEYNNGSWSINKNALNVIEHQGKKILALGGYTSFSARSQQVELYKRGTGAMRIRMANYIPTIRAKIGMSGPKGGGAYATIAEFLERQLLKGPANLRGKTRVAEEIATIVAANLGHGTIQTGILQGRKVASTTSFSGLLQGYKPIAGSLSELDDLLRSNRSRLSTGRLVGTSHEIFGGKRRLQSPIVLDLNETGQFIEIPGIKGGVRKRTKIVLPSDALLGIEATNSSVYLGKRSGIGKLGLGRQKISILTKLHEEMRVFESVNRTMSGFKVSDSLLTEMSKFSYALERSLAGKKGLLNSSLTFEPKGAISGIAQNRNLGSLQVALNEEDMQFVLKKQGYSKAQIKNMMKTKSGKVNAHVLLHRDPIHAPQNISAYQLVLDTSLQKGHIGINQAALEMHQGDTDWDRIALWGDSKLNTALRNAHRRDKAIYSPIFNLFYDQENKRLRSIDGLSSVPVSIQGDSILEAAGGDLNKAAALAAVRREGGAGGGATLTRYPDLFAKNLSIMAELTSASGDPTRKGLVNQIIDNIDDTDLKRRLLNASDSFGFAKIFQEASVYAALDKKNPGRLLSGNGMYVSEALEGYASGKHGIDTVKSVLSSALRSALEEGTLRKEELYNQIGWNPGDTADDIASKLTAYSDSHAQNIADLYTMGRRIGDIAFPDQLTNMYVDNGVSDRKARMISQGLAFFGGGTEEEVAATTDMAGEAYGAVEQTIGRINRDKIERASKSPGVMEKAGSLVDTLTKRKWGNAEKMVIGIGAAMAGISIASDLFDSNEPTPPIYEPISSPLPPNVNIRSADQGMDLPGNFRFPNSARVERPFSSRTVYNMSSQGDGPDFSTLIGLNPGSVGNYSKNSRIKQDPQDKDMPYQIRERLRGSF